MKTASFYVELGLKSSVYLLSEQDAYDFYLELF